MSISSLLLSEMSVSLLMVSVKAITFICVTGFDDSNCLISKLLID